VAGKKDNAIYGIVKNFDYSHAQEIKSDQIIQSIYREKGFSRTVEARLV
jgi:hypothetical protein